MTAESGLDHLPGHEVKPSTTYSADVSNITICHEALTFVQDSDNAEPLPDIAHIDAKILEATKTINEATSHSERQKAREQREDLVRLKRVEQIYVSNLG